jgi:peptidyl-prolyl cis-trans isomerase C
MLIKILKEPLLHFAVISVFIFILYDVIGQKQEKTDEITVTLNDINNLKSNWINKWGVSPTEEELNSLIDEHIKEEIFYREALANGLDDNDLMVRRRMAQKIEFILDDNIADKDPTEDDLKNYFEENKSKFIDGKKYSFYQISFLNDSVKAEKTKSVLTSSSDTSLIKKMNNQTGIPIHFSNKTAEEIDRVFGQNFHDTLSNMQLNQWNGPFQSGYGFHLILVYKITDGTIPDYESVKTRIYESWIQNETKQKRSQMFNELKARYSVKIEKQ